MTPDGLRAQYLIPNLSPSANAYPSIHPFRTGHVTMQSRKISANSPFAERKQNYRPQAPLPNPFEETFLLLDGFFHQIGPTNQTPSCTKFWC
jgi:hypothetical protein